jgi:hypothetical protein
LPWNEVALKDCFEQGCFEQDRFDKIALTRIALERGCFERARLQPRRKARAMIAALAAEGNAVE